MRDEARGDGAASASPRCAPARAWRRRTVAWAIGAALACGSTSADAQAPVRDDVVPVADPDAQLEVFTLADDAWAGSWRGVARDGDDWALVELDVDPVGEGEARAGRFSLEAHDWVLEPVAASLDDGALTFVLGEHRARLRAEDGALVGTLVGPARELALHLRRTVRARGDAEVVAEPVRVESDGATLAGTLFRPEGNGPHAAVVLLQGRGYGRAGWLTSLGRRLARAGVAALAFDGRGHGASTGDAATVTRLDRIADVEAAVALLAERDDVREDAIGLAGVSAGGWVAVEASRSVPWVSFLVLLVAPAEDVVAQQAHVVEAELRRNGGFTEAEIRQAMNFQRRLIAGWAGGAEAAWDFLRPSIDQARGSSWAPFVDLPDGPDAPELRFFELEPYNPVPALRATRVPVLAVYGGEDLVVPAAANVPQLRAFLAEAGNRDATIVTVPDLDHELRDRARDDGTARRDPRVVELVLDWVVERYGPHAVR